MPLFREPPLPAKPNETLGERAARLSQQRVPPPPGRGYALLALGGLAIGGVVYTLVTGEGAVTDTMRSAREKMEREEARKNANPPPADGSPATVPPLRPIEATVAPPAAPGPDTAATERPVPAVVTPTPSGDGEPLPEMPLSDLVPAVRAAPPQLRPTLRLKGLELFADAVADARSRRAALLDVARWAPDAAPEEAALFARITEQAVTLGLPSPTDAAAALLYLGSLRDRGGVMAVIAVENLVLDDNRPMELRVAGARILPSDARPRIAKQVADRPGPHPALLSALK
jgi:hypothetical protein